MTTTKYLAAEDTLRALGYYWDGFQWALPSPVEHGCHCELDPGMKPDGCVLDEGRPEQCLHAKGLVEAGKGRDDCSFWRPIEFAQLAASKEAR